MEVKWKLAPVAVKNLKNTQKHRNVTSWMANAARLERITESGTTSLGK